MKNILVICGPTASGKTALALAVAKSYLDRHSGIATRLSSVLRGESIKINSSVNILSVDSRQIYQGLDLVTGKDLPSDLPANIHIYGLDLIPADQTMNLAEFVQYAQPIIADSIKKNIPLIVVGGTGLYLKALTQNLSNVSIPPNSALREDLDKLDVESLQELLFNLDPEKILSLNNSDIYNPRRLIRAIEIAKSPQTQQSSTVIPAKAGIQKSSLPNFSWLGLHPDKETQAAKIRQRVIDRLEEGALEEVQGLLEKYPDQKLPIFTSLGVKEIIQFLNHQITREELIEIWTRAEIDYARRQMVWFQKQPDIVWYDKSNSLLIGQLAETLQKNA